MTSSVPLSKCGMPAARIVYSFMPESYMPHRARETVRIGLLIAIFSSIAMAGETPDFSSVYEPQATLQKKPINASPGPHLFIDDELIESSENLARRVCQPA